ncbi:MAG: hypothetical protein EBW98_02230 [Actinobacteria bacterium]|nr:hypothetical protein [Actinomycetota bacterium]
MTNDDTLGLARRVTEEIPASLADVRIDRVVSLVADVSRSAAAALIDAGAVTVDGVVVVAGKERVQQGQTITVDVSQAPGPELPAAQQGGALDIVYEDDTVVVVNKAAGVVVHPGAGNRDGTLVNFLLDRYPEMASAGDPMRPGIVHRLDAGTTGLMVVARTAAAYESLVTQMTARSVTRVYSAVVDGRASRTHYALEQSFHTPREASLLECRLETGRTHQIRVHLASIGHPVVGDAQYGGARAGIRAGRPMLHARELAFDHPRTGERVSFQVVAPADFATLVATLS